MWEEAEGGGEGGEGGNITKKSGQRLSKTNKQTKTMTKIHRSYKQKCAPVNFLSRINMRIIR